MWVYIYQSWTEKELKNAYIGEYKYVFDFQNDWELWYTWKNSSWTYWYTANEWFYQYAEAMYSAALNMPSWLSWTLYKIELRWTRPNSISAIWVQATYENQNNMIRFWTQNKDVVQYWNWWSFSENGSWLPTWEIHCIIELWDNWNVSWSCNLVSWSFSASTLVNQLKSWFNDGKFSLHFSSWRWGVAQYIRKVEYYTK